MSDAKNQLDEMCVLQSIYTDEEFVCQKNNDQYSGQFVAFINVPEGFHITYKNFKDNEIVKVPVRHLPPIILKFKLPTDYPSKSMPEYEISCMWLAVKKLNLLCKRLDQLWTLNAASEILYIWTQFLKEESLEYLRISQYLDLTGRYLGELKRFHSKNPRRPQNNTSVVSENVSKNQSINPSEPTTLSTVEIQSINPSEPTTLSTVEIQSINSSEPTTLSTVEIQSINPSEPTTLSTVEIQSINSSEPTTLSTVNSANYVHQRYNPHENNSVQSGCTTYFPARSRVFYNSRTPYLNYNSRTPYPNYNSRAPYPNYNSRTPYPKYYPERNPVTVKDPRIVFQPTTAIHTHQYISAYSEDRAHIEFLKNVFLCEVCFQDKIGSKCIEFKPCKHVYCKDCIKEYFQTRISEGMVQSMPCPYDTCKSEASQNQIKEVIGLTLFDKYDNLLLSATLNTMDDITYCPRQSCGTPVMRDTDDKMALCTACRYVFCVFCKMTYHGVEPCRLKTEEKRKLVEEYEGGDKETQFRLEKRYGKKQLQALVQMYKSENWISSNSKPCPNCGANIEKSYGCNKMVCWKCKHYFCWLCLKCLDPNAPYQHYWDLSSNCHNQLYHGVDLGEEEEPEEFGELEELGEEGYLEVFELRDRDDLFYEYLYD